jgi:hypothetical protein
MKQTIPFSVMFAEINSLNEKGEPKPFSLVYFTADRKRKTGGEIHMISKKTSAMDLLRRNDKRIIYTESQVVITVGKTKNDLPKFAVSKNEKPSISKNPNHFKNKTINILILSSKVTRTIHPYLISYFNDKQVLWY